jgi:hypothetical protein
LPLNGAIEMFAIYNRVLTNTQQFTIFKSTKNLYGL